MAELVAELAVRNEVDVGGEGFGEVGGFVAEDGGFGGGAADGGGCFCRFGGGRGGGRGFEHVGDGALRGGGGGFRGGRAGVLFFASPAEEGDGAGGRRSGRHAEAAEDGADGHGGCAEVVRDIRDGKFWAVGGG